MHKIFLSKKVYINLLFHATKEKIPYFQDRIITFQQRLSILNSTTLILLSSILFVLSTFNEQTK